MYLYDVGAPCPCGSEIGKDHYCRDCGFGIDPNAPCGDGLQSDKPTEARLQRIERGLATFEGLWREFAGILDDDDSPASRAFRDSIRIDLSRLNNGE